MYYFSVNRCFLTQSILLTVQPLAAIFTTVGSSKNTKPFLFIVAVLALVAVPNGPLEHAISLHFISLPCAFKHVAIFPFVDALPMDLVCHELTDILAQLRPSDVTNSRLLTVLVRACVVDPVGPGLLALALLIVI